MGKKRKASGPPVDKGPKEVDPADARLGPITSYADVADSEDEHFLKQDEIMFDDEPQSKRQRMQQEEEEFFEDSDEEVLGKDDESDVDSIIAAVTQKQAKKKKKKKKKGAAESDEDEEDKEPEDVGDENWWGSSKQEYYNADPIETEADALEEEAEAKRLQKKKLAKMTDEDFIFDQDEWLQSKEPEDGAEVVTEVLGDVEIPEDMSAEERYKLLTTRYPEFEHLVNEFQELHPQLSSLQKAAEGKPAKSLAAVKYWILGCYVAALASYFALLTSPARDEMGAQKTMDPAELRDHEIMETLVTCRNQWNRVKNLKPPLLDTIPESDSEPEDVGLGIQEIESASAKVEPKELEVKQPKKSKKKATTAPKLSEDVEKSLADLYDLPLATKAAKKAKADKAAPVDDDHSDFGEEEALDAKEAAEKAQRKKSLRFYTSQIVQKANKRAGAGRDAGGDMDIPYRERLKDRQARLNAEAERRGQKHGPDLDADGDDSNDEDAATAAAMRADEDDYYDMVSAASKKKKAEKADRKAALAAASKADRVVAVEEVGEDGKRKVSYQIEKNKGLTPKRKKENRNPRVKKRKAYDTKMKKLGSMKPVYKGEPEGGYQGVQSGIKAGLIKSTKF
ncbi:hypothetical protein VUR80DRAFT_7813 [Thermomyces stellatus]